MSSRAQHQSNLPPMEVRGSERSNASFRKTERRSVRGDASDGVLRTSEQVDESFGKSEQLAAEILNDAFAGAGLDNKEVAHLCGVSVSLVEKWRSSEARGCPSFAQMLRLPPSFHISLHRSLNKRFGFGRAALARLIGAAEDLALVVAD